MRLIDADAIRLKKGFFEKVDNVPKFYDWLDEQPTVDAVPVNEYRQVQFFNEEEIFGAFFPIKLNLDTVNRIQIGDKKFVSVVRCGECRHKCGEHDGYICCDKNVWHEPNWFCADGERKE